MKHKPTDEQQAILDAFEKRSESMLVEADAGCAKALRSDQDVITPAGAKPIGKLSIGDTVFGVDGKPYPVLGVFPQGVKPLYKLLFSDGTAVIATGDHLWKMQRAQGGFKKTMVIDTNFMRKKPRIKAGPATTWGNGTRAYWFLPMCKEVLFETKARTVDPWLMGFLLGDGCLQKSSVSFSTADLELVAAITVICAADYDLRVTKTAEYGYDYRITSTRQVHTNPLLNEFQVLGLAGCKSQDKFIPRNYLMGDKATRLAVLQGLFDSDGAADKTRVMYSTASFALAQDVKWLVESLGGTAVMGEMRTAGMIAFRFQIKLPPGIQPFRLARKKANYKTGQRPPYRALESITQVEDGEAICISVGSPDKLFLTSNFIPTHNTTTMEMLAHQQAKRRPLPALAVAFNKKTATELQARMPPSFQCKTLSGLGYGAWAQAMGGTKLKLCEYKINDLIKEIAEDRAHELKEDDFKAVQDFVREARQAGLIHKEWSSKHKGLVEDDLEEWAQFSDDPEPSEQLIELAREVLRRSTEEGFLGNIDFDDMVYLSVLFGGRYKQFPLVMVDEVQDLNLLNIMQVGMVSQDRIVAVGDRKQSIYQFRGAHGQAIEELKKLRPAWIDLPLHVTFRCPRVMVARQQAHAPGFTAAPGNPDGEYIRWIKGDEAEGAILWNGLRTSGWNWKWLKSLCLPGEKPFVLCRNNAPLLRLAFKLIREGVVPEMLGRDIGKGLVSLSKKISPKDGVACDEFALLVEKWQREETAKARKNNREYLVSGIADRGECLIAVAETTTAKDVGGLRKAIAELFRKENGELRLSTIHRSKGLEESVVMHLDGWRMPSRFALEAAENGDYAQLQQEKNLRYVGETRTRRIFVEANVDDYQVE